MAMDDALKSAMGRAKTHLRRALSNADRAQLAPISTSVLLHGLVSALLELMPVDEELESEGE